MFRDRFPVFRAKTDFQFLELKAKLLRAAQDKEHLECTRGISCWNARSSFHMGMIAKMATSEVVYKLYQLPGGPRLKSQWGNAGVMSIVDKVSYKTFSRVLDEYGMLEVSQHDIRTARSGCNKVWMRVLAAGELKCGQEWVKLNEVYFNGARFYCDQQS